MTQPPPPASARPEPYPGGASQGGADAGRIAFAIAIAAAAIGLLQQIFGVFLPQIARTYAYGTVQMAAIFGSFTLLHTAICLVALIFGIRGAQSRRSPVHAGIAIGVGAVGVMGGVIALAVTPILGLVL
jgi:hypothetical protein